MAKKQSAVKQKHKKVLKKILENPGKSLGSAMREEGYSEEYSDNPQELTATKSWQELVEEVFPDDLLTKTHKEALEAKRQSSIKGLLLQSEFPDFDIRLKALDMAYKLKGTYAPEKYQEVNPYENLSDSEIEELILRKKRELNIIKKQKPIKKK